jgi:electron transport complex protein RnfE
MATVTTSEIINNGLWRNNPALVQVLGLCPTLAVTGTLVNGLVMGLATMVVLLGSNMTVSLLRNQIPHEIRIPIYVILIASFVTNVQLLMNAYVYDLYLILGIFIPLIVTNCIIIGRAEAFAIRHPLPQAALDGLAQGVGFTLVLTVLGALREMIGQGTLLSGADLLFGPQAADWTIHLFQFEQHMLLALLPPGAFFGLGLLIALKNAIDARRQQAAPVPVLETIVEHP